MKIIESYIKYLFEKEDCDIEEVDEDNIDEEDFKIPKFKMPPMVSGVRG